MCFVILKVGCELAACLMVDAGHSHQDILFDERGLLLALGTPSSSLLALPSRNTFSLVEWADSTSRSLTLAGRRPAQFFKMADGVESSDDAC